MLFYERFDQNLICTTKLSQGEEINIILYILQIYALHLEIRRKSNHYAILPPCVTS